MAKKQNLLNTGRPLTVDEVYEARPRLWWVYTLIILIVCALLGWSGSTVRFTGFASKGVTIAQGIGNGLLHPDTSLLFNLTEEGVPYQLLQTMAIAVLGTLIGGLLAVPFSFLACDKIVPKPIAFVFSIFILLIRTIPSLVWALVWIRVTGPNAFCGVVTQSICSIGMICKMYITAIEDIDTRILESLDASGCTGFQKVRYGILPQIIPNFISTIIYRFDINMKDATTLGIVGAGGIGAALIQCITSSRWSMVGSYLFGMVLLMIVVELFSTQIRTKLARG
ncbi:MAG: ABC transporter permease [Clostridia bacterium]|nr:ABC transporter permease [Clostridia bacterium]